MPPLKIRLALHRQYALQLFGSVIWSSLNRKLESLEISYNANHWKLVIMNLLMKIFIFLIIKILFKRKKEKMITVMLLLMT